MDFPTMTTYPDVLGFITPERATFQTIHAALSVFPANAPANAERRVIVLLQNIEDAPQAITLRFELPRGRFAIKPTALEVSLPAGGVGVLAVALKSAPDVTAGDYAIGVDITVKAGQKGAIIRAESAPFDPETLPPQAKPSLAALLQMTFSAKKRGLIRGNTLEAPFTVGAGAPAEHLPKTGWSILWTLETQTDVALLVDKYGNVFVQSVLKAIKHESLFQPMAKITYERFKTAGYPLTKAEAMTAARLLVSIFDIAKGQAGAVNVGALDVFHTIQARLTPPKTDPKRTLIRTEPQTLKVILPRWATAYFRLIANDRRYLKDPHAVIIKLLYDDVLM
jgi:hypothetical protein